jgi:thymidylate kinase
LDVGATPPTVAARIFLDVRPEVAATRKADRCTEAELRVRADLYRKLHGQFGVICIDGEQSPERVSTEIILQTLEGL